MGERYWISGVQLGMLKVMAANRKIEQLIDIVLDDQFIANFKTDKDKAFFKRKMKELG